MQAAPSPTPPATSPPTSPGTPTSPTTGTSTTTNTSSSTSAPPTTGPSTSSVHTTVTSTVVTITHVVTDTATDGGRGPPSFTLKTKSVPTITTTAGVLTTSTPASASASDPGSSNNILSSTLVLGLGIAAGVVLFLAVLALILWMRSTRSKRRREHAESLSIDPAEPLFIKTAAGNRPFRMDVGTSSASPRSIAPSSSMATSVPSTPMSVVATEYPSSAGGGTLSSTRVSVVPAPMEEHDEWRTLCALYPQYAANCTLEELRGYHERMSMQYAIPPTMPHTAYVPTTPQLATYPAAGIPLASTIDVFTSTHYHRGSQGDAFAETMGPAGLSESVAEEAIEP
ncbi:hypothetical protein HK101_001324, partial [Irineochytrium annulatum]